MSDKLHQIFKNISELEPSSRLKSAIFRKIALEQKRQTKRDLALYRVWSFGSLTLAIYAIFAFGSTILKSEFWNILTLVFSDIQIVAANWNDYAFSIMETLPVISIILILIPFFTLILSLNFYWTLKDKNNFKHYNYA